MNVGRSLESLGYAAIVILVANSAAWAQAFPSRTVSLIVPFPPGGATDIVARAYAQPMSQALGQAVVVENRPGAGATIGTLAAAKAPPDGHTLLLGTLSNLACAPSLYPNAGYDPVKSFSPVARITSSSFVILVHEGVPADSVSALVKLARARPGELTYSSVGSGTLPHIAGEMFKSEARVDLLHVPYKGGEGVGTADLLSGRVHLTFNQLPQYLPYVQAGRLKVLAVAGPRRLSQLPQVPTSAEAGLPEFQIESWFGLVAPAGTPTAVITRLNAEVVKAAENKGLRETLAARGADAKSSSPQEMAALIADGVAKCSKVIRESRIKLD